MSNSCIICPPKKLECGGPLEGEFWSEGIVFSRQRLFLSCFPVACYAKSASREHLSITLTCHGNKTKPVPVAHNDGVLLRMINSALGNDIKITPALIYTLRSCSVLGGCRVFPAHDLSPSTSVPRYCESKHLQSSLFWAEYSIRLTASLR